MLQISHLQDDSTENFKSLHFDHHFSVHQPLSYKGMGIPEYSSSKKKKERKKNHHMFSLTYLFYKSMNPVNWLTNEERE